MSVEVPYKLRGTSLRVMRYELQGRTYEIQVTRYKVQVTRYKVQVTRYKVQVTRYELLAELDEIGNNSMNRQIIFSVAIADC
jgi:hypothetical protein